MQEHNAEPEVAVRPADPAKIKKIVRVAVILGIVTAIEFLIAFTVPSGSFKIFVFVALTVVKAFYIVSEFMHLGHEVKTLIWSIIIPLVFVVWMLIAFLYQGGNLYMWG